MMNANGMDDIGNLPARIKVLRNKDTGICLHRPELFGRDKTLTEQWTEQVRYANAHGNFMEMLENEPGDERDVEAPVMQDGRPYTVESLTGLHFTTLVKVAAEWGVSHQGKTPKRIAEEVVEAVDASYVKAPDAGAAPKGKTKLRTTKAKREDNDVDLGDGNDGAEANDSAEGKDGAKGKE